MIKPKKLNLGDTIGIIAPSGGLSAIFPHRLDTAIKNLEQLGFKVKLFPTMTKFIDGKAGTKNERILDLQDAFLDKEVKAIFAAIGGICINEILESIDYEIIKQNPKIFVGYSDNTLLNYAFYKKAELISFYGPCVISELAEFPKILNYTEEYLIKSITSEIPIGEIKPSLEYTDELLDWSQKLDLTRPRDMINNEGHIWLKNGFAEGELIGGCLHSILQLKGTNFDLNYSGKILFFEIPEGQEFGKAEPLSYVESQIVDLRNIGVFDKISGLIVGRAFRYNTEEKSKFKELILDHLEEFNFPILFGSDIGHSDPMLTIPFGVKARIDSKKKIFEVIESGVK
ncbi:MAG: LD-carboxypeptidase [Candidatus Woesearchaeota archaeon]|jgi:muramoyltetrapeptide carboxypeptidase|nr:LD-carboxypeptidase [Candidatus Woesearchaeota archaeon]